MRAHALALLCAVGCAAPASPAAPETRTVRGRVLLPEGDGPRGVEVRVHPEDGTQWTWVTFDDEGRFAHSENAEPGALRATAWATPIPRGPEGEFPSLGSLQFPELALPGEVTWLLPSDAEAVTIQVERPHGDERGRDWRTGPQQFYGPYAVTAMPDVLRVD